MKQELEGMKRLLMVVDTMKAFREIGNMAITDIGEEVDNEIVRLIQMFLNNSDYVMFLLEGHTNESVEFNDFLPHGILGTEEAKLKTKQLYLTK